jgi:hypothetical protein
VLAQQLEMRRVTADQVVGRVEDGQTAMDLVVVDLMVVALVVVALVVVALVVVDRLVADRGAVDPAAVQLMVVSRAAVEIRLGRSSSHRYLSQAYSNSVGNYWSYKLLGI